MQRDPEDDYLRPVNGRYDDERDDTFVRLVWLGIGLTLLIMLIPLLNIVIQDPEVRWGFLLVILLICGAVLFLKTYPKAGYRPAPIIAQVASKDEPGAAEREVLMVTNALQGTPYSQMLSYLELREMLVRRFMLLHHLPRAEAESILSDPRSAKRLIRDEELIWLLTYDFKWAYGPESLESPESHLMIQDFNRIFPRLLRKLEALR